MTWEYRVVKKTEQYMYDLSEMTYNVDEYVIYEVYYDKDDKIQMWTENPQYPYGESLEDLIGDLELMKKAFSLPVIDEEYLKELNSKDTIALGNNRVK